MNPKQLWSPTARVPKLLLLSITALLLLSGVFLAPSSVQASHPGLTETLLTAHQVVDQSGEYRLELSISTDEASGIRVVDQQVLNRFPTELTLSVEAEGSSTLSGVTLFWRTGNQMITSYAYPEFFPAKRITAEHTIDLLRFYAPPGVEIHYQWLFEAEDGGELRTEWASFTLADKRFDWQSLRYESIEVYWHQGDQRFGQAIMESATEALELLRSEVGVDASEPVKVFIYGDQSGFQTALGPRTHDWAGGRAFPRQGIVVILAPPSHLGYALRAVPHELSHVIIDQATRNPYGGIPRWLDEGLAMMAEGELETNFARALDSAVRQDRLISVRSLNSNFPTDPREAELSYAQSYSLVKFIIENYSREGISDLLAVYREGATYDEALTTALGLDTYGLEDEWRISLGLRPVPAAEPMEPAPAEPPAAPIRERPGVCIGPLALLGMVAGWRLRGLLSGI